MEICVEMEYKIEFYKNTSTKCNSTGLLFTAIAVNL
jgi:hypothetical protein